MLNDDKIVTSVQEESNCVEDEMNEDENNNNNESSKDPINVDVFSALKITMERFEQQSGCCPTQLLLLKRFETLQRKNEDVQCYNEK
ncbi:hypothetical protein TNCV_4225181 [Trichonephila clavipes]|uniref:Uncharacterized protein n=1 Tax=Trichonephila clavipes TaxID=2585209 RepID=A0A8X6SSE8_TRICX|nr:hypothetical protein TNCV_4225181 [Trichonephila clavipes]